MKYIILIGNEKLGLNVIKSIEHFGSVKVYDVDENRYCVDYGIIVSIEEFISLGLPLY